MLLKGPPSATTEEVLAWLIGQVREHQERLQRMEGDIRRLPEQWQADIEAMREELTGLQHELVRRLADARIRLRLLGLLYVIIGLILTWLGSVVH
jgi:hypothetical protein